MSEQLSTKDLFSNFNKVCFYKDKNKNYLMIIEGINQISSIVIKESIENEIRKYRQLMNEVGEGSIGAAIAFHQDNGLINVRIEFQSNKKMFVRNIAGVIFHFLNRPYFEDVAH